MKEPQTPDRFGWKERMVCRQSGLLPGPHCTDRVPDLYLPLVSSTAACTHLAEFSVDKAETVHYCPTCKPETGTHPVLKSNFSPAYVQFLQSQNKVVDLPPPHDPNCPLAGNEDRLQILSPVPGKQYFLEEKLSILLPVRIFSRSGEYPVSVYLNGKPTGQSVKGEEVLVNVPEGKYILTATDARGQSASVTFLVSSF